MQKERISIWQQQEKLGELMAHYFKRLPPHEGVPRLLEKALELQRYAYMAHADRTQPYPCMREEQMPVLESAHAPLCECRPTKP